MKKYIENSPENLEEVVCVLKGNFKNWTYWLEDPFGNITSEKKEMTDGIASFILEQNILNTVINDLKNIYSL